MAKLFIRSSSQNNRAGFLLLEIIVSLLISMHLAAMLFQSFALILPKWEKLVNLVQLYDTSHYTFSILEKNLGYDSLTVAIVQDEKNRPQLSCQALQGNLSYIFSYENNYLYKTIHKSSTSGKNPLYVSNCLVENWKITKLGEQNVLIEISFKKQTTKLTVQRIIHCLNGRVL